MEEDRRLDFHFGAQQLSDDITEVARLHLLERACLKKHNTAHDQFADAEKTPCAHSQHLNVDLICSAWMSIVGLQQLCDDVMLILPVCMFLKPHA